MVAKMDLAQEEAPAPEKKASDDDVKKKGIALITHDLKQKKLVPIKVLIVVVLSGKNCHNFQHELFGFNQTLPAAASCQKWVKISEENLIYSNKFAAR